MPERDLLRRLASRLATDRPIEWDTAELAAATDQEREQVRQLRMVAAMATFNRSVQLDGVGEVLTSGNSLARSNSPKFAAGEQVAGRYLIIALAGRGGMGEVYEAWDEELSIPVALKTLRLPAGSAADALQRLRREGLLARSVSHPNVCRVYDLSRHGDGPGALWFLTMEVLRGETLAERLVRGRIPPASALPLAQQMAAGLGAAHQTGVIHRDFKPSNVMLVTGDLGEQAVVTDFGIARAMVDQEMGGSMFGTPAYMAPEQLLGEEAGPAADIYALGIVLYEMVTGRRPFGGGSVIEARRRLVEAPPSPRSLVPELDERWEAVILKCLAREPGLRFGRAEEVGEELAGRVAAVGAQEAPRVRHALPAERDAFVGREPEIAELGRKVAGGARLVTLVGTGGIGKTRLAVRYGWQSLADWPGGVWFCDLTEARSLNAVALAVAGALGVSLGRGDPIERLGHAIAGRGRCLVIIDNAEQVLSHAAAAVKRWIAGAARARFVVTSRERLGLGELEELQAVEPLPLESGVELFTARARWLRPGLELAGPEAEAVREVVRLVEGMPLAIELAAARMRMMSATQIVAQMQKRFHLLTGGRSARHETLAAVIDGSWELLRPWERSALAQCSVFEGGFTLEAAESVVDLHAWPEAPWTVEVVQSLIDKSLIKTWVPEEAVRAGMPEARYGMYASLQAYAHARLRDAAGEAERAAAERHGQWYARFGTEAALESLNHHGGAKRSRQLQWDLENLRSACRRAMARGDGEIATATFMAAGEVLRLRGPFAMAVELGRQLVDQPLRREDRGRALVALGQVEVQSGRMEEARAHYEAALAISREVGNRRLEGSAHGNLGMVHEDQGRMQEARACYEQALAIYREVGNRRSEGVARGFLGNLHLVQGRMEEAAAHYQAALAIHREVGNRRIEGVILGNLGVLHSEQGRMEEAVAHYEAAVAIARQIGDRHSERGSLTNLGILRAGQGRVDEAQVYYEEALAMARDAGDRRGEANVLGNLGMMHHEQGRTEEARAHYEAALVIHREVGGSPRYEGIAHESLARLMLEQGRIEEARVELAAGETLLREVGDRLVLGSLLCVRAEFAQRIGDLPAAHAALHEAEDLAGEVGAGPDSQLGRQLAKVRSLFSDRTSAPGSRGSAPPAP